MSRSWQRDKFIANEIKISDIVLDHIDHAVCIYLEEGFDVGVARSNISPIVLAAVPVLEVERRRVDEEEVRDFFSMKNKYIPERRKMSKNVPSFELCYNDRKIREGTFRYFSLRFFLAVDL